MGELMNAQNTKRGFRWHLLVSASALALLASGNLHDAMAAGEDTDRPSVWIELGGQLEQMNGQGSNFPVGFLAANFNSPVLQPVSPFQAQNPPPFSFGGEGKISFQPEGSDWVFSAAIRYGRSSNSKEVDHQTSKIIHPKYLSPYTNHGIQTVEDFADTREHHQESAAILDFSAGKDFGLGMFGRDISSTLSAGVRFAQFASRATTDIRARPDLKINYVPSAAAPRRLLIAYFHTYHVTGQASRNSLEIGPSVSWAGSAPVAGNAQSSEISFDWGANAAILFGRQKAHVKHQSSSNFVTKFDLNRSYFMGYRNPAHGHDTDRTVIVPNVGGFAGISFRHGAAKVSFGYRADLFFGAIDGGIDVRKSENVGFYGPFATIGIGL